MNTASLKVRLYKHFLVFSLLAIISAGILFTCRGKRDIITFCAWSTGYISFVLLAFSLIIGPFNILTKRNNPISTYFRRDLGIMAGSIAIIHSVTGLFVHLRGKMWMYFLTRSDSGYSVRLDDFGTANYTGLVAAILILILILTSNDRMMICLTPGKWKNIQRLSYLIFILVLIHVYFYWVGSRNYYIFFSFYVPLVLIIIMMQSAGIIFHLRRHNI